MNSMDLADRIYALLDEPMVFWKIRRALNINGEEFKKARKELEKRGVIYISGATSSRVMMRLPTAIRKLEDEIRGLKYKLQAIEK
jgi:hypothetical protein